jgi:hypothetical protein
LTILDEPQHVARHARRAQHDGHRRPAAGCLISVDEPAGVLRLALVVVEYSEPSLNLIDIGLLPGPAAVNRPIEKRLKRAPKIHLAARNSIEQEIKRSGERLPGLLNS